MVSRTLNTIDGTFTMEETDDGRVSIIVSRHGQGADVTLAPDELDEVARWIRDHQLEESINDCVAE